MATDNPKWNLYQSVTKIQMMLVVLESAGTNQSLVNSNLLLFPIFKILLPLDTLYLLINAS